MKNFKVTKIINETHDTKTIRLVNESSSQYDFSPGQYITVNFPDLGILEGKAYSISSLPTDPFLSITVKAIGVYSKKLCSLDIGDLVVASDPYGYLFEDTGQSIVCIAAGVGISPIWSIIRSVLNSDDGRSIDLHYSNKTVDDIVFRDDISEMMTRYPDFKVTHYITRQKLPQNSIHNSGRLDSGSIAKTVASANATVLICGGQEFVTDVYKQLISAGVMDEQISTEVFFARHGNN